MFVRLYCDNLSRKQPLSQDDDDDDDDDEDDSVDGEHLQDQCFL